MEFMFESNAMIFITWKSQQPIILEHIYIRIIEANKMHYFKLYFHIQLDMFRTELLSCFIEYL